MLQQPHACDWRVQIKGVPFSKLQGWHGPHEQARSAEKRRGPAEGPWSGLTEPNVMVIPSGSRPVPEIALGQGFPRMFPGGSEVLELDDDVGTSRSSQLSALGTRNLTHPETSEGRAAEAGRPLHPAHGGGISADPDSTSRLSLVPSPDSDANVGRVVSNSHRPGGSAGSETSVQLSPSAGPESSAGSGDTSPVIPSRRPGSSSGPITSFEGLPGQYSNMAAIPEDRPVRGSAGLSADADMGCEASGPRHDVVGLPGTASGLEASLEVSPDSSPAMSHPGLEISSAAQTTTNIAASSGRRHTSDPDMRLDASPQPDTLATDDDLADPATSYEHAMGPGSDISGGSETDSELEISFRPGSSAGDPVDMLAAVSGMDSNGASSAQAAVAALERPGSAGMLQGRHMLLKSGSGTSPGLEFAARPSTAAGCGSSQPSLSRLQSGSGTNATPDIISWPGTAAGSLQRSPSRLQPGSGTSQQLDFTLEPDMAAGLGHHGPRSRSQSGSEASQRLEIASRPGTAAGGGSSARLPTRSMSGSGTIATFGSTSRPGTSTGRASPAISSPRDVFAAALIPERRLSQQPVPALSLPAFKWVSVS